MSQPAVSHQIKTLERELGEQLFVRGRNAVSLTPSGEVMLEHAAKILDITDSLREEIEETRRKEDSTVILSMVARGTDSNFADLYRLFRKAHPSIKLELRLEPDVASIRTGIRMDRLNVGLVSEQIDSDEFVCVPYGWNKLQLVVGADHRLASMGTVTAEQLRNERWGLFRQGDPLRDKTDKMLAEAGLTPRSIFESNDGMTIRNLIAVGELIGFMPSTGIVKDIAAGSLKEIKVEGIDAEIEAFVFWKSGKKSASIAKLVRLMIEQELPGFRLSRLKKKGGK